MIFTLAFLKGATERSVRTFAQVLAAVIGAGQLGVLDVDWTNSLSIAGLAAVASLLTSIGNADFVAGAPVEDDTRAHAAKRGIDLY